MRGFYKSSPPPPLTSILRASGESRSVGILTLSSSSSPEIMLMRRQGGVKSISTGSASGPLLWYWILKLPCGVNKGVGKC